MNGLFKYNSSKQEYLLNAINEYLEMEEFDSAIEFIIGTRAIVADRTFTDDRVGSLIAEKGSVVYAKENPICNIILKFGAVNINTETKEVMVCE